jgi:hypothetical protein
MRKSHLRKIIDILITHPIMAIYHSIELKSNEKCQSVQNHESKSLFSPNASLQFLFNQSTETAYVK